jgi:outer membrane protein OmpA-like peptidoglycan-associated protein
MRPAPFGIRPHGAVGLICLILGVAGCMPATARSAGPGRTLTEQVARSAFVSVVPGSAVAHALSGLIAATTRPNEDVDVLQAGAPAKVLTAATSPAPAKVVVPGRPAAPGTGATSYQKAVYREHLKRWQGEVATNQQAGAARTRAALSAWAAGLGIPAKVPGLSGGGKAAGSLAAESAVAASTLDGLQQAAGTSFGGRRVLLLYATSLTGSLPAGELTGDDVIVVTSFLPSAAAASAAQASLLAAGAAGASVLGPEATATQLEQLITAGLSHKMITESLSGPALFGNDSAALRPGAARVLRPLLAPLRKPGATAVINGYASATGSARRNDRLSYARAAAVAEFLEVSGVSAASLTIIGHGAHDLVASGPSGANRRVVVVIEEPADD